MEAQPPAPADAILIEIADALAIADNQGAGLGHTTVTRLLKKLRALGIKPSIE